MTVSDLVSKGPALAAASPQAAPSGSVFASLVNSAASEPQPVSRIALMPEPRVSSVAKHAASADLPLAAVGFGPGMLLRLGQLGLHTTGDLARADAELLRAELGGISRLVDVEAWIAQARQSLARA
ncbi:MAG TPA: hypothetical protein VE690_03730 [Rhodopila sp.]|jgi:hypothetical protein|nr:hypothetical protein [Rhodopila sp.]